MSKPFLKRWRLLPDEPWIEDCWTWRLVEATGRHLRSWAATRPRQTRTAGTIGRSTGDVDRGSSEIMTNDVITVEARANADFEAARAELVTTADLIALRDRWRATAVKPGVAGWPTGGVYLDCAHELDTLIARLTPQDGTT